MMEIESSSRMSLPRLLGWQVSPFQNQESKKNARRIPPSKVSNVLKDYFKTPLFKIVVFLFFFLKKNMFLFHGGFWGNFGDPFFRAPKVPEKFFGDKKCLFCEKKKHVALCF
jgi:hypothetical protein